MSFEKLEPDRPFCVTILSGRRSDLSHRADVAVYAELGLFIRFLHRSLQVRFQDTSPVSFIADTSFGPQPIVQAEGPEMSPCSPDILFSKHLWDEAPLDKSAQFRDTFKGIDPRRLRLLEKRDQWVREEGRLTSQTHRVRQDTASRLAQQLLVGTPRQRRQSQQKIHQSQVKKGMANFQRERVLPQNRILQTSRPHWGQPLLHRP